MSANLYEGKCAHECNSTWAIEHGGAMPGGPFPGEWASAGDVRRCPHGKLWQFTERSRSMNYWERLYWFWSPVLCFRAARLLAAPMSSAASSAVPPVAAIPAPEEEK